MPDNLPDGARATWDAYLAMEKSKQAHFNALQDLELKHTNGSNRTLAESVHLENLLAAHNDRVQSFGQLTRQLQNTDLAAYEALIQQIKSINANLGRDTKPA